MNTKHQAIRNWQKNNPEKVKAIQKRWREKRKSDPVRSEIAKAKAKIYCTLYRAQYRDRVNLYHERYKSKNADKIKEYRKLYRLSHVDKIRKDRSMYGDKLLSRYKSMIDGATRRNYVVSISLNEFSEVVSNPCLYCGESEKKIGVDRIDNSKGYTLENSAPCCKVCNTMKLAMTVDEFFKHIKKINNFNMALNNIKYEHII